MLRLQRGSADPLERRVMGRRWLAVAAAALVTSQLDGATGRVRAPAPARESGSSSLHWRRGGAVEASRLSPGSVL